MHGGVAKSDLGLENVAAVQAGIDNLGRHLRNITQYGVPVAVAINRFTADSDGELSAINRFCSCLLYTSPSPRDKRQSRMPSSA